MRATEIISLFEAAYDDDMALKIAMNILKKNGVSDIVVSHWQTRNKKVVRVDVQMNVQYEPDEWKHNRKTGFSYERGEYWSLKWSFFKEVVK